MATTKVNLTLSPSEYRTLRLELEQARKVITDQIQTAKEGGWIHNSDGKALSRRHIELTDLLNTI